MNNSGKVDTTAIDAAGRGTGGDGILGVQEAPMEGSRKMKVMGLCQKSSAGNQRGTW